MGSVRAHNYRADIDGLRAIAVLAVVAFHAFPAGRYSRGGFIGVDIFFVISGFLITSIIIREADRGTFSILRFYGRRVLRIFPALATVLAFCIAVGWFLLLSDEYAQLGKHVVGGAAFISNILLWLEVDYFDGAAELKPLLHLWSLGVEEQFYIVWPLFIVLVWGLRANFLFWTVLLGALSFVANIYFSYTSPEAAFFLPFQRFWQLLAGAFLAYAIRTERSTEPQDIKSVIGLLLIVAGLLIINRKTIYPGLHAVLPIAGAYLLIAAGPASWVNRTILAWKPMVAIGLISYPLYLWHWPLLAILRIGAADGAAHDVPIELRTAAVVVSFLLAWATFRLVEAPIRFRSKSPIRVPALVISVAAVGILGFAIFLRNGFPERITLEPSYASVLFEPYPHPRRNMNCDKIYPELRDEWSCLLSKPEPATLALIGDSHAHQYWLSLSRRFPNDSVLNVSFPGCAPFSSNEKCRDIEQRFLELLRRNPSIKTVVLTGYFSFLAAGFRGGAIEGSRVANVLTDEARQSFLSSARRVLSAIQRQGKEIVILRDIPDMVFKPRSCVSYPNSFMAFLRGGGSRTISQCGILRAEYDARDLPFERMLDDALAGFQNLKIYDPKPLLCDEKMCRMIANNRFLYWNSDHLTVEGSNLVVDSLFK